MENCVFVCDVCGNKDPRMIGYLNGVPYCRKCIQFRGEKATNKYKYPKNATYNLAYELTDDQKKLSKALIQNYKSKIICLFVTLLFDGLRSFIIV